MNDLVLLKTDAIATNESVAYLRRNHSYGARDRIQERDRSKQVLFEHDWAVMCSLEGDGQNVPEGDAGQQVPAARPKIQRDPANVTRMQM